MLANMKAGWERPCQKAIVIQQLHSCCVSSISVHCALLQEIDTMVSQANLELLAIRVDLL